MPRPVVPVGKIARRLIEHGRIRYGIKTDKGTPTSIDRFRFTSHDESVLEKLADLHGGEVKPWSPAPHRKEFELISNASEISIYLPPDPLGGTPIYELWTKGGWQRRCTGEICELPAQTPDGQTVQEVDCICAKKNAMECKPVTRLSVILPEVHFGGIWRLETKGWNAAQELPGMVELVHKLQREHNLTSATLALEMRSRVTGGQTRKFVTPVIRLPASIDEFVSGNLSIHGVKPPTGAALEAGHAGLDLPPELAQGSDDGILDAEVIDVEETTEPASKKEALTRSINQQVIQLGLSTADLSGFCFVVSDGEHDGLPPLSTTQLERIVTVLGQLLTGERVYLGLDGRRAKVGKPAS